MSNPPPTTVAPRWNGRRIIRARRPALITTDPSMNGRISTLTTTSSSTTTDGVTISSSVVPAVSPTFAIGVGGGAGRNVVVVGPTPGADTNSTNTTLPNYRTLRRRAMRAIQQQHEGGERNNNNGALGSSSTIGVAGGGNVHGRASSEIEGTTTTVNELSSLEAAMTTVNELSSLAEAMSSLLHGTVTSAGVDERVSNGTNSISGEIFLEMYCFNTLCE